MLFVNDDLSLPRVSSISTDSVSTVRRMLDCHTEGCGFESWLGGSQLPPSVFQVWKLSVCLPRLTIMLTSPRFTEILF